MTDPRDLGGTSVSPDPGGALPPGEPPGSHLVGARTGPRSGPAFGWSE